MNDIFTGIFDTELTRVIGIKDFLLCMVCSLLVGIIIALTYMFKTRYTKSFVATLALLPAVVCVVIMMVNGNVGTGVAVAGAFSLVRFRSAPGSAKEICAIFLAMGSGLIVGMGYLAYAIVFAVILGAVSMLYSVIGLGSRKKQDKYRVIRITIPEDLDYTGVFDEIFQEYTDSWELQQVKTTNMGSLFRLNYNVTLSDASKEKELIDAIRVRNGNLEITVSKQETATMEL
ncbi:MAG: DUF4956 domain-containing protein [Wujia sp.]